MALRYKKLGDIACILYKSDPANTTKELHASEGEVVLFTSKPQEFVKISAGYDFDHPLPDDALVLFGFERLAYAKFLYHHFKSLDVELELDELIAAAADQEALVRSLQELEIMLPPKAEQKKIIRAMDICDENIRRMEQDLRTMSSIPAAYFDLYFVQLEFPGSDDAKIINGIPEGWKLTRLSKIAEPEFSALFVKCAHTCAKRRAEDARRYGGENEVIVENLDDTPVLIPPAELLALFEKTAEEYTRQQEALQYHIDRAYEARDDLFPTMVLDACTKEKKAKPEKKTEKSEQPKKQEKPQE